MEKMIEKENRFKGSQVLKLLLELEESKLPRKKRLNSQFLKSVPLAPPSFLRLMRKKRYPVMGLRIDSPSP